MYPIHIMLVYLYIKLRMFVDAFYYSIFRHQDTNQM